MSKEANIGQGGPTQPNGGLPRLGDQGQSVSPEGQVSPTATGGSEPSPQTLRIRAAQLAAENALEQAPNLPGAVEEVLANIPSGAMFEHYMRAPRAERYRMYTFLRELNRACTEYERLNYEKHVAEPKRRGETQDESDIIADGHGNPESYIRSEFDGTPEGAIAKAENDAAHRNNDLLHGVEERWGVTQWWRR